MVRCMRRSRVTDLAALPTPCCCRGRLGLEIAHLVRRAVWPGEEAAAARGVHGEAACEAAVLRARHLARGAVHEDVEDEVVEDVKVLAIVCHAKLVPRLQVAHALQHLLM